MRKIFALKYNFRFQKINIMKTILTLIISFTASCLPLNLSSAANSFEAGRVNSNDSALILKLENDFAAAVVSRDEKTINRLISDNFIYTENEKMYSRSEVIQSFFSESDIIESAYNEDLKVHQYDKTAIVTGWLYINGKSSGVDFKRKYRFTDVWYYLNGYWQIIAAQDYLLP